MFLAGWRLFKLTWLLAPSGRRRHVGTLLFWPLELPLLRLLWHSLLRLLPRLLKLTRLFGLPWLFKLPWLFPSRWRHLTIRLLIEPLLRLIGLSWLLELTRLLTPSRRNSFAIRLLIELLRLRLVSSAGLVCILANTSRNRCLPRHLRQRTRSELVSGNTLNPIQARARVGENSLLAPVNIYCLTVEVLNDGRLVDNRGVVDDQIPRSEVVREMTSAAKHEE